MSLLFHNFQQLLSYFGCLFQLWICLLVFTSKKYAYLTYPQRFSYHIMYFISRFSILFSYLCFFYLNRVLFLSQSIFIYFFKSLHILIFMSFQAFPIMKTSGVFIFFVLFCLALLCTLTVFLVCSVVLVCELISRESFM